MSRSAGFNRATNDLTARPCNESDIFSSSKYMHIHGGDLPFICKSDSSQPGADQKGVGTACGTYSLPVTYTDISSCFSPLICGIDNLCVCVCVLMNWLTPTQI